MTWNIHGGVGPDGKFDLRRVIDLVLSVSPDVVALQEVDSRSRKFARTPAFEDLAAALGPHSAEARLIAADDGDYGHVLISRWPIDQTQRHDISLGRRERRAAIETTVLAPHGKIHVVAAHLGLSFRERRHQAERLRAVAERGPPRSVVLGDFNDCFGWSSVQTALAEAMPGRTHHRTFPAWRPILALDRIYYRPCSLLVRSWTLSEARAISDHLPIVADLAP